MARRFVAHPGQIAGERGTGGGQPLDQPVPAGGSDRLGVPGILRPPAVERHLVDGRHQAPHPARIETAVGRQHVDPSKDAHKQAADLGEQLAAGRELDRGRRHARRHRRRLEGAVLPVQLGRLERRLHRPQAARCLELCHLALLAASDGARERRVTAQSEGASDPTGILVAEHAASLPRQPVGGSRP